MLFEGLKPNIEGAADEVVVPLSFGESKIENAEGVDEVVALLPFDWPNPENR